MYFREKKVYTVTNNKAQVHTENIWQIYTDSKLGPSNPKFNPPATGSKRETQDDFGQPSHSEDCTRSMDFNTLELCQIYNEGKLGLSNSKFNPTAAEANSEIFNDFSQL